MSLFFTFFLLPQDDAHDGDNDSSSSSDDADLFADPGKCRAAAAIDALKDEEEKEKSPAYSLDCVDAEEVEEVEEVEEEEGVEGEEEEEEEEGEEDETVNHSQTMFIWVISFRSILF